MRTVSIFKNGNNRAIRLPRDPDFDGVSELEIVREGDSIILRPVRPTGARSRSWTGPIRTLWRSVRMWSAMKDALSHEENPDARHQHLLVHHARAAGSGAEAPEQAVLRGDRIVVSAVTYAEMRFGATGPKASPRHIQLVDAFCARLDAVLPGTAPRWTPRRTSGWRCA